MPSEAAEQTIEQVVREIWNSLSAIADDTRYVGCIIDAADPDRENERLIPLDATITLLSDTLTKAVETARVAYYTTKTGIGPDHKGLSAAFTRQRLASAANTIQHQQIRD